LACIRLAQAQKLMLVANGEGLEVFNGEVGRAETTDADAGQLTVH
jgi:ATP-dependent exoDNAse (exonuclease V) alpha subunit